ncbi:MAG TPA: hypothetical protein VEM59_10620 [Acidimicrobiia bacterium]|nr:hypothetical protein [Acidimicrobiia bacterium]
MDHSGLVLVQVVERVSDHGHRTEDGRDGHPGVTAFANDLCRARAVDPVHDEHIAVVDEEVVPHDGERRMRPQPQERPALGEQPLAHVVRSDAPELQRHEAFVLAVERLHDLVIAAPAEQGEQLVPPAGPARPCGGV